MDPLAHQVTERSVDLPLPLDPVQAGESGAFDNQREMAFAPRVVPGVPDMLIALVFEFHPSWRERGRQPLNHLAGDRSGGSFGHRPYI